MSRERCRSAGGPQAAAKAATPSPATSATDSAASCASATAKTRKNSSGALGLIIKVVVLYNTIYTQRAPDLAAEFDDADIERLSPLGADHITLTGRYRIALLESLRDSGSYRELNTTPGIVGFGGRR